MTFATRYTVISDEGTSYQLTQKGVPVSENCENQSDGDYCDSIPSVDYDYSDYSTVTYVSVIVLTGICKRRKQATDCSRLGHRGPRVHAARACRFFGIPSVVY